MGRRVLDRLVEPVAGGVYAADPDRLDVATVAPGLPQRCIGAGSLAGAARTLRGGGQRAGSAVATLSGGLHTLVRAPGRGRPGRRRRRSGPGARSPDLARAGPGWRVELASGDGSSPASVVLARPAGAAAAALLATAVPAVAVDGVCSHRSPRC